MIPVNQLSLFLAHNLQMTNGSENWTLYSIGITGAVVVKNGKQTEVLHERCVGSEFKPLLRSFNSITKQERQGYYDASYSYTPTFVNNCTYNLHAIEYYIRLGFDVFGWIEKGWAIEMPATATQSDQHHTHTTHQ